MKYKNILKSRLLGEYSLGIPTTRKPTDQIRSVAGGLVKSYAGDFIRGQAAGFGIGPRAMRDLGVPGVRIQPGAPGSGSDGGGGGGGSVSGRTAPESLADKIERLKTSQKTRSYKQSGPADTSRWAPNRGERLKRAADLAQKKMDRATGLGGIPAKIVQALPKSEKDRITLARQGIAALGRSIGASEGGPGGKRTFSKMGDVYSGRLRQPGETSVVNSEQERAIADYAQLYGISRRDAAAIIRGGGF